MGSSLLGVLDLTDRIGIAGVGVSPVCLTDHKAHTDCGLKTALHSADGHQTVGGQLGLVIDGHPGLAGGGGHDSPRETTTEGLLGGSGSDTVMLHATLGVQFNGAFLFLKEFDGDLVIDSLLSFDATGLDFHEFGVDFCGVYFHEFCHNSVNFPLLMVVVLRFGINGWAWVLLRVVRGVMVMLVRCFSVTTAQAKHRR